MNFLLRPTQHIVVEPTPVPETPAEIPYVTKPSATLEGLIAEDPFPQYSRVDDSDGVPGENGGTGPSAKSDTSMMESHSDVSEEEGWITIPYSTPSLLQLTFSLNSFIIWKTICKGLDGYFKENGSSSLFQFCTRMLC